MTRSKGLVRDTLVLAFGTLGGRIVGILLLPLYTRALTPAEFGTVDLITTSVEVAIPLLYLCLGEGVLRYSMLESETPFNVLKTALVGSSFVSLVLLLISGLALYWSNSFAAVLIGVLISVQATSSVFGAWARAVGKVHSFAISGVIQALSVGVSNLIFLWRLGWGIEGFLLSLVLGNVAAVAVLVCSLPVRTAMRQGVCDTALLKKILWFSAPLVPNVIMWWLTNISGRYFLLFFHGVDQVGILGVASRFSSLVAMGTAVFAQAWQLSAYRASDEADRSNFFSRTFRVYQALLMLLVSTILLTLKPLVRLIAAPEFFEAWRVVPILLIGAVFAAFSSFYGAIYTAARNSGGVFRTTIIGGVSSVLLNVALVPLWGTVGAALAICLSFLFVWLVRLRDSQRFTPTSISPYLTIFGFTVLVMQVSLCYAPFDGFRYYSLLAIPWVVLVLGLRSEVLGALRSIRLWKGSSS